MKKFKPLAVLALTLLLSTQFLFSQTVTLDITSHSGTTIVLDNFLPNQKISGSVSINKQSNQNGVGFLRYFIKRNNTDILLSEVPLSAINYTGGTFFYHSFEIPVLPGQCGETFFARFVSSFGIIRNSSSFPIQTKIWDNTISGNQSFVNSGVPNTLIGSTPKGGTCSYDYQWQQRTGANWSNITGAISKDYNFNTTITTTTHYRRKVISGAVVPEDISDPVTITINNTPPISNNIISMLSGSGTGCGSASPTFTGSTPTGGNGTYSYQWQSSVNGTDWSNISSANSKDYSPGTITQTRSYRRLVTSSVVNSTSNTHTVNVYNQITNNTICCDQTVLNPTIKPANISGSTPSGGTGSYFTNWQYSKDQITWSNVSPNFSNPGSLTQYNTPNVDGTTYFRRQVGSHYSGCPNSISNTVTVTVTNPSPFGSSFANPIDLGTFTWACKRVKHSVNSMQAGFTNSIGGNERDVYYKFQMGNSSNHFSTCRSDVNTNIYLLDANGNVIQTATEGTSLTLGCKARFGSLEQADMQIHDPNWSGSNTIYYLVVEGNGILKTELAVTVYSDCVDNYLNEDEHPHPTPGGRVAFEEDEKFEELILSEKQTGFKIYPNPVEDNMSINLTNESEKIESIQLYSINGKLIYDFTNAYKSNFANLNVSTYQNGTYLLKVTSNKGSYMEKIIISK